MKIRKITLSVLFILISNFIIAQNNSWNKINKVQKKLRNITYTFPAEVNKRDREIYVQLCENSVRENLEILNETEFLNKMDIEFLNSRHEMQKYTGLSA